MFTALLQNAIYSSDTAGLSVVHLLTNATLPSVQLNETVLTVNIPAVAATLTLSTVTYTAQTVGVAGNNLTVTHVAGEGTSLPTSVSLVGGVDLIITLGTDEYGIVDAIVSDIVSAVAGTPEVAALFLASGSASALVEVASKTSLTSGASGTTVGAIQALIAAKPAISALFSLTSRPTYYDGSLHYDGDALYSGFASVLDLAIARTWLGSQFSIADLYPVSEAVEALTTSPFDGPLTLPVVMAEALYAQLSELVPVNTAEKGIFNIDGQAGSQLDQIGVLLGKKRETLVDADYKKHLKARGLINRSIGTFSQINDIFDLLAEVYDYTKKIAEPSTAFVEVNLFEAGSATASVMNGILVESKAAGVGSRLTYSGYVPGGTFTLDGTTSQGLDAGHLSGIA